MIKYDVGTWHVGFIFRCRGATVLKALPFALPAACLAIFLRVSIEQDETAFVDFIDLEANIGKSQAWSALNITIGLLLATRSGQSLKRFWEGLTLVHQMSAEWYDAVSSLVAFSHSGADQVMVKDFQHTIVRLMSLMHGSALHQCKETDNEDFEALGVADLDTPALEFLNHCKDFNINRVEIVLHWVHELVTSSIGPNIITVPPPILSRVYQELSRGLVNLNDARKITETPFPFPFAQVIVIMLLTDTCLIPFMIAMFVDSPLWAGLLTFVCTLSMWSVNIIAGELEQPFGNDANDLPLAMLQENFNRSLLVLLDPRAQRAPGLIGAECLSRIEVQAAKCTMKRVSEGHQSGLKDLAADIGKKIGISAAISRTVSSLHSSTSRHAQMVTRVREWFRTGSGSPGSPGGFGGSTSSTGEKARSTSPSCFAQVDPMMVSFERNVSPRHSLSSNSHDGHSVSSNSQLRTLAPRPSAVSVRSDGQEVILIQTVSVTHEESALRTIMETKPEAELDHACRLFEQGVQLEDEQKLFSQDDAFHNDSHYEAPTEQHHVTPLAKMRQPMDLPRVPAGKSKNKKSSRTPPLTPRGHTLSDSARVAGSSSKREPRQVSLDLSHLEERKPDEFH